MIEIVLVAFFAGMAAAGALILIMIYQVIAEATAPVGTIPQAFSLDGVSDIHLRGMGATVRGIEFDRSVASMTATRTRLTTSGDSGFTAMGTIPVIHNDTHGNTSIYRE